MSNSLWKFLRRARFSWIDLVIISIIGSILKVAILDHLHLGWH